VRSESAPTPPSAIDEDTQLAAPVLNTGTGPRWTLTLPDGTRLQVNRPILLGRDPAPIADGAAGRLIKLCDPRKTVSKTHALVEPATEEGGVRVRDLHSTNGVAIVTDGDRVALPEAGEGIAVPGATIELGSFSILVTIES
jgi:ferric-dicitrate binding protein FerR (iron transport regulator)